MAWVNSSPNSSRKLLLWLGLAMALALLIIISSNSIRKIPRKILTEPPKTSTSQQLVSGFPEFPVYPGARLKSSHQTPGFLNFKAVWEVNQPGPPVMDWYITALSGGAWAIEEFPEAPDIKKRQFAQARNDHWRVYLAVSQENPEEPTQVRVDLVPWEEDED